MGRARASGRASCAIRDTARISPVGQPAGQPARQQAFDWRRSHFTIQALGPAEAKVPRQQVFRGFCCKIGANGAVCRLRRRLRRRRLTAEGRRRQKTTGRSFIISHLHLAFRTARSSRASLQANQPAWLARPPVRSQRQIPRPIGAAAWPWLGQRKEQSDGHLLVRKLGPIWLDGDERRGWRARRMRPPPPPRRTPTIARAAQTRTRAERASASRVRSFGGCKECAGRERFPLCAGHGDKVRQRRPRTRRHAPCAFESAGVPSAARVRKSEREKCLPCACSPAQAAIGRPSVSFARLQQEASGQTSGRASERAGNRTADRSIENDARAQRSFAANTFSLFPLSLSPLRRAAKFLPAQEKSWRHSKLIVRRQGKLSKRASERTGGRAISNEPPVEPSECLRELLPSLGEDKAFASFISHALGVSPTDGPREAERRFSHFS